jgi:hypothetical protein
MLGAMDWPILTKAATIVLYFRTLSVLIATQTANAGVRFIVEHAS